MLFRKEGEMTLCELNELIRHKREELSSVQQQVRAATNELFKLQGIKQQISYWMSIKDINTKDEVYNCIVNEIKSLEERKEKIKIEVAKSTMELLNILDTIERHKGEKNSGVAQECANINDPYSEF